MCARGPVHGPRVARAVGCLDLDAVSITEPCASALDPAPTAMPAAIDILTKLRLVMPSIPVVGSARLPWRHSCFRSIGLREQRVETMMYSLRGIRSQ